MCYNFPQTKPFYYYYFILLGEPNTIIAIFDNYLYTQIKLQRILNGLFKLGIIFTIIIYTIILYYTILYYNIIILWYDFNAAIIKFLKITTYIILTFTFIKNYINIHFTLY